MSSCSSGDTLMQAIVKKVNELQEELSRSEQSGPTSSSASAGPDDPIVLAGFDHCFRETLDYLINQERLDFDHPLVKSLLLYLIHKRKGVLEEVDVGDKENTEEKEQL